MGRIFQENYILYNLKLILRYSINESANTPQKSIITHFLSLWDFISEIIILFYAADFLGHVFRKIQLLNVSVVGKFISNSWISSI